MPRSRGPEGATTLFVVVLVVGVLMVVLPPLVFGAAEGDKGAQPFLPTWIGWGVAAIGAVGALVSWLAKRRSG